MGKYSEKGRGAGRGWGKYQNVGDSKISFVTLIHIKGPNFSTSN